MENFLLNLIKTVKLKLLVETYILSDNLFIKRLKVANGIKSGSSPASRETDIVTGAFHSCYIEYGLVNLKY